jgi:Lon protease-like protein
MAEEIPLFPLGLVLVPGGYLPLRIFEQRYLDMVRDATRDDSGFGVCLVAREQDLAGTAEHARTGTLARIRDFYTMDDGLLGITAQGRERFKVEHTRVQDNGLLIGAVTWLEEPEPMTVPARYEVLSRITANFMEQLGKHYPDYDAGQLDNAVWIGYRLTELLPLENDEKQVLLEMQDPLQRLQWILETLPRFQSAPTDE